MTVPFRHHLRNGDKVTNTVMQAVAEMGFKYIHLAASGIFVCFEPPVKLWNRALSHRPRQTPSTLGRLQQLYPLAFFKNQLL